MYLLPPNIKRKSSHGRLTFRKSIPDSSGRSRYASSSFICFSIATYSRALLLRIRTLSTATLRNDWLTRKQITGCYSCGCEKTSERATFESDTLAGGGPISIVTARQDLGGRCVVVSVYEEAWKYSGRRWPVVSGCETCWYVFGVGRKNRGFAD